MRRSIGIPALLGSTALHVQASRHSFSVNDDLLAFPQYEVNFSDDYVDAYEAEQVLLYQAKTDNGSPTADIKQYSSKEAHDAGQEQDEKHRPTTYQRMVIEGQDFLCNIPQAVTSKSHADGRNETAAKADKEKELARAVDRGWELLSGMQDNCIYFLSGWWSYRFCYGEGVKQFHQLSPSRGVPVFPPLEDPTVPGYQLGLYKEKHKPSSRNNDSPETSTDIARRDDESDKTSASKIGANHHGELVERGETRYLVQRLSGGTKCDLTGKDRRIEIQFHCNPHSPDRISVIKETAICAYLMVIQTPRLCNDVAFLPPQKDHPNEIACSPILTEDQIDEYEANLDVARREKKAQNVQGARDDIAAAFGLTDNRETFQLVGDIVVGGRARIPEGKTLQKGAAVRGTGRDKYIDTLATSDGRTVSEDDLKRLGLTDMKAIEKLKEEIEKHANGHKWKLEAFDTPHGTEYRGIVDAGDEEEGEEGATEAEAVDSNPEERADARQGRKSNTRKSSTDSKGDPRNVEGSEEEYYKEEL